MREYHLESTGTEKDSENLGGEHRHYFDIIHSPTATKVGRMETASQGGWADGEVHVNWISTHEGVSHGHFQHYKNGFKPEHVRGLLKDLKTHYPEMTSIAGDRVSGIRRGPAAKFTVHARASNGGMPTRVELKKSLDASKFYLEKKSPTGDVTYLRFHVKHPDTEAEVHGSLEGYKRDSKTFRITGFYSDKEGHASKDGENYQNYFGPRGVRAIGRSLKQHIPEIERISASRVSGIRTVSSRMASDEVDKPVRLAKALDPKGYYLERERMGPGPGEFTNFKIRHKDTKDHHGFLQTRLERDDHLHIEGMASFKANKNTGGLANSLGPTAVRALVGSLKQHFPHVKVLTAYRVSGVRTHSGGGESDVEIRLRKALDPKGYYLHPHERLNDPKHYAIYYIRHKDTGDAQHGRLGGSLDLSGNGTFYVGGIYSRKNGLGPTAVRALGRSLRQHVPGIKALSGFRISGARVESGRGSEDVQVPFTKAIVLKEVEGIHPLVSTYSRVWDIRDSDSDHHLGRVNTSKTLRPDGNLRIHNIYTFNGPTSLGPSGIHQIHQELKKKFPGIKSYSGYRITGARAKAGRQGTASVQVPDLYKAETAVEEQEYVRHPAIKVGKNIYEGNTHREAAIAALSAGEDRRDVGRSVLDYGNLAGFTTTKGRYVTRYDAAKLASKAGQIQDTLVPSRLDSGDFRRHDRQLPPNRSGMIFKTLKITNASDPFTENEGYHRYDFHKQETGVRGSVRFYVNKNDNSATVSHISAWKPGMAEDFKAGANLLGPKDVMQLQRHIASKHGVTSFRSYTRMSGIRNAGGKPQRFHSVVSEMPPSRIENLGKAHIWSHNAESFPGQFGLPEVRHVYHFKTEKGNNGLLELSLRDNDTTGYVHSIHVQTTNHPRNFYYGANAMGPKDLLSLKRQVLERHPTIKRFATDSRISGAKQGKKVSPDNYFGRKAVPVSVELPPKRLAKALEIKHESSHAEYGEDCHRYSFRKVGTDIKGSIRLNVEKETGNAHVANIWATREPHGEFPHSYFKGANLLGPKDIMQLQRHISKLHPEIKSVSGSRISGVRRRENVQEERLVTRGANVRVSLPTSRVEKSLKITERPALSEDSGHHVYHFENEKGTGVLSFSLRNNGKTAYIHNIFNASKPGYFPGANSFGPKDIQELKRHILKQHPTIRQIESHERISGARHSPGNKGSMSLKVTLPEKDVK